MNVRVVFKPAGRPGRWGCRALSGLARLTKVSKLILKLGFFKFELFRVVKLDIANIRELFAC